VRKSLDTANWEKGEEKRRALEAKPREDMSAASACKRWLADCEARSLAAPTLRKYRHLAKEIETRFGELPLAGLKVDDIRALRESWKLSSVTMGKRLELLRAFFSFCVNSEWIEKNPAKMVRAPQANQVPTMPFSKDEFEKIIWALEIYCEKHPQSPPDTRKKLSAMILLMRYSGVRISDAVSLKSDRIADGRLFLYQAKTGVPVYIPLPKEVLNALSECEEPSGRYFWPGGTLKTWTTEWQARLKKVAVIAGVADYRGFAHRLRDNIFGRTTPKRRTLGNCLAAARPQKHPHDGKALRAVGEKQTGCPRGSRQNDLVRRFAWRLTSGLSWNGERSCPMEASLEVRGRVSWNLCSKHGAREGLTWSSGKLPVQLQEKGKVRQSGSMMSTCH